MVDAIKTETTLLPFIKNDCIENQVGATYDEELSDDDVVTIDIDEYYHSLRLTKTPAVPDRLVVVRCLIATDGFTIYIIEMKNISRPDYFKRKNIDEKFKTAIEDFMSIKYNSIFLNKQFKI